MIRVFAALIALLELESAFAPVVMTRLGKSWYNKGKAKALITHDRILNDEIKTRGLPWPK